MPRKYQQAMVFHDDFPPCPGTVTTKMLKVTKVTISLVQSRPLDLLVCLLWSIASHSNDIPAPCHDYDARGDFPVSVRMMMVMVYSDTIGMMSLEVKIGIHGRHHALPATQKQANTNCIVLTSANQSSDMFRTFTHSPGFVNFSNEKRLNVSFVEGTPSFVNL